MLSNTLKGLVNLLIGALVTLLAFRFVLKLFGAAEANQIVNWIYTNTEALVEPFNGIFSAISLQNSYIIEIPVLLAILAYSLIGIVVYAAIAAFSNPAVDNTQRSYDVLTRSS